MNRRIVGGFVVAAAVAATVLSARKFHKPYIEEAPAFRQDGPAGAPIVITEFSDFECPACRVAEEPLHKILQLYNPNIRFIFKHFPLERIHPWARPAALITECAGQQGKFWPLHDMLYARQSEWTQAPSPPDKILNYVQEIGLDPQLVKKCATDPLIQAAVSADMEEARQRWVNATPTFFVNGQRYIGGQQLSVRGSIQIDKILKR